MTTITVKTSVAIPPGQQIEVSGNGTIDIIKGFGAFDSSSIYINGFERTYGPIGTLEGLVTLTPKTSMVYAVLAAPSSVVSNDPDNALDEGSDGLPYISQSSVSGAASAQCQNLLRKLDAQSEHASILLHSDSTGNAGNAGDANNEWPWRLGQWLAAKYPQYTVRWREWNTSTDAYNAPVTIAAGSGSYNIDLWCCAASGKTPAYATGARYLKSTQQIIDTSVYADVSPVLDLYIINHGHNISTAYADAPVYGLTKGLFYENVDCLVLQTHTQCGVIVVGQNPSQTQANKPGYIASRQYATERGFGFADVWGQFIARGQAASLYADSVHPSTGIGTTASPTGTDLYLQEIVKHFQPLPNVVGPTNLSTMLTLGQNLVSNGLFKTWTNPAAAPDGWSASSGVSCAKDTSGIVDSVNGYALKMTALGNGTAPYIEQYLPASGIAMCKGKTITLAVRMYQPAGTTSSTNGRLSLYAGTGRGDGLYTAAEPIPGNWIWRVVTVEGQLTAGYVRVQVYLDTFAATPAGQALYVDQIVVVAGPSPRAALN